MEGGANLGGAQREKEEEDSVWRNAQPGSYSPTTTRLVEDFVNLTVESVVLCLFCAM